jgi:hypothetical protein
VWSIERAGLRDSDGCADYLPNDPVAAILANRRMAFVFLARGSIYGFAARGPSGVQSGKSGMGSA